MIPLRALVVGRDAGAPPAVSVETRAWRSVDVAVPGPFAGRPGEAVRLGLAEIDTSPLLWADVLVIRGPLATLPVCDVCGLWSVDEAELLRHSESTGHEWRRPADAMVRALVEAIDRDRALLRGRGLVYEAAPPEPQEADLYAILRRLADVVVEPGAPRSSWRHAATSPRAVERLAIRTRDAALAVERADRRDRGLPSWDPAEADDPLVSVVIPVAGEPGAAVERAIRSALGSDGVRIEVVVAGDHRSNLPVADGRVRFVAARGGWAEALSAALDAAAGSWIAPLDPTSVFADGHVAGLLSVALEHQLDVVYGRTLLVDGGEIVGVAGDWPPTAGSVALDATLFLTALRAIRPDPGAAAEGDDPRWNLVQRWLEAGVRIANVEEAVTLRDLSIESQVTPRPGEAA